MSKFTKLRVALLLVALVVLAGLIYRLPPVYQRLSWRVDFALTYLRSALNPAGDVPTPLPRPQVRVTPGTVALAAGLETPTLAPPTPLTPEPTPTPTFTATPLPRSVSIPPPEWEKQGPNNCGPATLAMYLRFWGWEGGQQDIADVLKPRSEDRNVNVEEIVSYMLTKAGWLHIEFRVGGDAETLKAFLAAGIPVMVEESFYLDEQYWPDDDRWSAHYNLVTGYDDATKIFTTQDSFRGADQKIPYEKLDEYWQGFNRVYILIYPPEKVDTVKSILGPHWDMDYNRQYALEIAQAETEADPENGYAWFNLGTNLVYFERYDEAAQAYDRAREAGLPQRMLRYQFGPFFAYFHSRRIDDLMTLTKYALQRTPNSEEALLWQGWGLYRQGESQAAIDQFNAALEANWNYSDAKYAIEFVQANP